MKIRFIMLGRTRNDEIRALFEDYLHRIKHYADIEITELRDASESLLRKVKCAPNAYTVLLDPSGKEANSVEFANWLGKLRDGGPREIIFFCGAAEGYPAVLKKDAHIKISLSRLTMPHEMARLVLVEQVYRAFTILGGHPYSK